MADLTNGSSVFQTYNNAGTGVAELGDNYAAENGQGIAGKTIVATIVGTDDTNVTQAELDDFVFGIGKAGGDGTGTDTGGPDAFTVVGVQGTADGASGAVYVALQGTGTLGTAKGAYATDVTAAAVVTFDGLQ
jgi:hypothetical protein